MRTKKKTESKEIEAHWFKVDRVEYDVLRRPFVNEEMRVSYYCGARRFTELVSIESEGYAGKRARDFWREMHPDGAIPVDTADGLLMADSLNTPNWIYVHVNDRYPRVLKRSLDIECPPVYIHDPSKQQGGPNG